MTDGTIQLAPDSTGKIVDTSELTRPDSAGTVVERQRIGVADPDNPSAGSVAQVSSGELSVTDAQLNVLLSIDEKLDRLLFLLESVLK